MNSPSEPREIARGIGVGQVLSFAGLAFIVLVAGGVLLLSTGPSDRSQTARYRQLKTLGLALETYRWQNGVYPHSEDGPEVALYLLYQAKPKLPASAFDRPDHEGDNGPARYDHAARRVENAGYLYLNPPPDTELPKEQREAMCLMVERYPDSKGGVTCLYGDGHVEYLLLLHGSDPGSLLGKSGTEVHALQEH